MVNGINKMQKGKLSNYIKGFIIEIIVAALFLAVFAFVMYLSGKTFKFAPVFANLAVAAGCFASSLATAGKFGSRGWLTGVVIGGITFIIIMLVSLIVNQSGVSINTLFRFIIIMLSSLIGGIVGVNKGNSHKYI